MSPIMWQGIQLLDPTGVKDLEFHKQTTPRHFAQAWFMNHTYTGNPNLANKVMQNRAVSNGTAEQVAKKQKLEINANRSLALTCLTTGLELCCTDLNDRFGWESTYCSKAFPDTTTDPHLKGLKAVRVSKGGSSPLIPIYCAKCARKDKFGIIAVCHFFMDEKEEEEESDTHQIAAALLGIGAAGGGTPAVAGLGAGAGAAEGAGAGGGTPAVAGVAGLGAGEGAGEGAGSVSTASSSNKYGKVQIIFLFPHDVNCQANGNNPFLKSALKIFKEEDWVRLKIDSAALFSDCFKDQLDLIEDHFMWHPEEMKSVAGLEPINLGNTNLETDDRSYIRLPLPAVKGNPKEDPKQLVGNLTMEHMATFCMRHHFLIMVQMGLQNEMAPFILDWEPLPKQPGGSVSKNLKWQHQIKFKRNPNFHLYINDRSVLVGGADPSLGPSTDVTIDEVEPQGGHRDHSDLNKLLESGVLPSEHPLSQLVAENSRDEDASLTSMRDPREHLTLPFSCSVPMHSSQSRRMWFGHPNNPVDIHFGQMISFKGNAVHGGWTYPLHECLVSETDTNGHPRQGRMWRPVYHVHVDSIHCKRQLGQLDVNQTLTKHTFVGPTQVAHLEALDVVQEIVETKKREVHDTIRCLMEASAEPWHYRNQLNHEKAQMVMARVACARSENITDKLKMKRNQDYSQAQVSLLLAGYFLKQAEELDDNISEAEKKTIGEMTKCLVKKANDFGK